MLTDGGEEITDDDSEFVKKLEKEISNLLFSFPIPKMEEIIFDVMNLRYSEGTGTRKKTCFLRVKRNHRFL